MSVIAEAPITGRKASEEGFGPDDFDLDVAFVEVGSSVEKLIYMTDDGCGTTCQSACSTTCP